MAFLAGDMEEIVCVHKLGTFRFQAKAGESFTIDNGGIRNNDDASMITGMGQVIRGKNRVAWSVEGPVMADIQSKLEEDALNQLAESPDEGVWTFSHISGMLRKGAGNVVGDIKVDTNNAQITLKVSGGGVLELI